MYIDKDHSQFLLKGLSLLRQNEDLCDVELRVGDSSVFAHKVVLAAVSEYFFESKYSITIAAAVASIQPTGCQELSRPLHDLWSQDPELS